MNRTPRQIEPDANVPLHEQLRAILEAQITSGRLEAGHKLPSEHALCEQYGVSRITVRQALARLDDAGLVVRRRGAGTFVRAAGDSTPRPPRQTISLLLANAQSEFMAQLVKGVEGVLQRRGYELTVNLCHDSLDEEASHLRRLQRRPPDGAILFPVNAESEHHPHCLQFLQLQDAGVPTLLVDRYLPQLPIGYVVADDRGAMQTLVEHLIAVGHRRIGYIDDAAQASSVLERRQGFITAMARHGLRLVDEPTLRVDVQRSGGPNHIELGERVMRQRLASGEPLPEALVASNTYIAVGAFRALRAAGLRVPEDVALVGFGDYPEASVLEVPLTTIATPIEGMGRRVAEELLAVIEGRRQGLDVRVRLPGRLVVRRSCGAPASSGEPTDAPASTHKLRHEGARS